jgi:hypothetical protein
MNATKPADPILHNGRITTLDPNHREAKDLAVKDGRVVCSTFRRGRCRADWLFGVLWFGLLSFCFLKE